MQQLASGAEGDAYRDLGLDPRPDELVELLVADLSLARAFYAGIPAARLLARIRLASDERDFAHAAEVGPSTWDALMRKLLPSDAAHERVKRAVIRNTRAASHEGPLQAGDAIVAVLVFALAGSTDADASLAEVFADRSLAIHDPAVTRTAATYEPRLLGGGDQRGVLFEACVRLATRASAGPWPRDRIAQAARQLHLSELALRLLRPSSATLLPLDIDPEIPRETRRMALLERGELDSLVARDPRDLATAVTRMERAQAAVTHLDRLLADLTKLLTRSGALVLAIMNPDLPIEDADAPAIPSESPLSWMPTTWTSPDAAAQLAEALERGALTSPRLRAVVQRGGEPALDAIGAEMLRVTEHPFASAAFAEVLARTGRARDVMRLVTYFAVAPDPTAVAYALSVCTSPALPSVLHAWLTSMLPSDGALAPAGEDPVTSAAARLNACVSALRPYPVLYGAVRPLLARVTDAPPPGSG